MTVEQVSDILEIDKEEAKQLILSLKQDYIDQDRSFNKILLFLEKSFR